MGWAIAAERIAYDEDVDEGAKLMRYILALMLMACTAQITSAADLADSPELRRQAAERYAQVVDPEKMLADVTEQMAKTMPEEQRERYKTLMRKHVRVEVLKEGMLRAMTKNFTTRELNALADFYGSPEGQSAVKKLGAYMADVMPLIQAEMAHALEASRAEQAREPKPSGT